MDNMQSSDNLHNLRHSLAHVLAAAVQQLFPDAQFGVGPVVENGFFYDFELPRPLTPQDLPKIEKRMKQLIQQKLPFVRRELSFAEAEAFYRERKQPLKVELIRDLREKGTTYAGTGEEQQGDADTAKALQEGKVVVYTIGKFDDLCRGGHVENTGDIDPTTFHISRIAGAYWRGDETKQQLQRIYGLAFGSAKELEEYLTLLEEAAKRDHRKLGAELGLFVFSPQVGSGLPLFTPRGTIVRNAIRQFSLELQLACGYEEVFTPSVNKAELFKTSGHYEKFHDSMFHVRSNYSKEEFFLKPMNCPQHTQIYASEMRSYRDLPLRYSDFATLYRDEKPGELGGLTRVRYFSQDDSHCFCREDQIEKEMTSVFGMIKKMMQVYGMEYWIRLSLRDPKAKGNYLGSDAVWKKAEQTMESFLKRHAIRYERAEGEAAFYGPKMDLMAKTAIGHNWQLATIQLDYIMPERFGLKYVDRHGKDAQPVMIHKAMAGSLERFMGILLEHYAGNFPTWLAPIQVAIVPVGSRHVKPAEKLAKELRAAGIRVSSDDANETVGYKIRKATQWKVPYLLVIGDKEAKATKLVVRVRGSDRLRTLTKKSFLDRVTTEITKRT